MSFDAVLLLSLPDLKEQLSDGNSQTLRNLRAYLGLGSGVTKEENRALIFDHVEKQRHLQAGLQPPERVSAGATAAVPAGSVPDPLAKSDP